MPKINKMTNIHKLQCMLTWGLMIYGMGLIVVLILLNL